MSVAPTLVIAIGNPSRGDDALGPLAIDEIAAQDWPGVELLTDFQLQVEHALDLVGREHVVFIDATLADGEPWSLTPVAPAADSTITSHALSPAAVLDTYRRITDAPMPRAHLLAVRGYHFELGAPPTAAALRNLHSALDVLARALGQRPPVRRCPAVA